ncbi:hypothetical protein KKG52_03040 [Patescibacteria group bacterium]|nr:hypothetical protein [Patescibacteria group bacterium]
MKNKSSTHNLTIGWLYPDLMNTYGDYGNIVVLTKRSQWRNIDVKVLKLSIGFNPNDLKKCDLLFMGGAQDRQQQIVSSDLSKKSEFLKERIEKSTPGLYICGAYQFLGKYYEEPNGNIIKGLEIFDLHTTNQADGKRLIGNIIIKPNIENSELLIGFENHGGRTYLGAKTKPLGNVKVGFGNNGEDETEGAIYKESIGTYLHGPILPKNSWLADRLIKKAIENKYKRTINLEEIDDSFEIKARNAIAKSLGIKV